MSKRKVLRRFRGGQDDNGIDIITENDTPFINIDLNNDLHLHEIMSALCYDRNITDIIKITQLKPDIQKVITDDKSTIEAVDNIINSLDQYKDIDYVQKLIDALNSKKDLIKSLQKDTGVSVQEEIIQAPTISISEPVDKGPLLLTGEVEEESKKDTDVSVEEEIIQTPTTSITESPDKGTLLLTGEVEEESKKDTGVSVEDELIQKPTVPITGPTDKRSLLLTGEVEEANKDIIKQKEEPITNVEKSIPSSIEKREIKGRCAQDFTELYNTLLDNYDRIDDVLKTNNFKQIQKLFADLGITLTKSNNIIYISGTSYKQVYLACHTDKNLQDTENSSKIFKILVSLKQIMEKEPINISAQPTVTKADSIKPQIMDTMKELEESKKDTSVSVEDELIQKPTITITESTDKKPLLLTGEIEEPNKDIITQEEQKLSTITRTIPTEIQQREIKGRCSKDFTELYNTLLDNYDKIDNALKTKNFNIIQKLFTNLGITLSKTDKDIYISGSSSKDISKACHSDKNLEDTDNTTKIFQILVSLKGIMAQIPITTSIQYTDTTTKADSIKPQIMDTMKELEESKKDSGVSVEDELAEIPTTPITESTDKGALLLTGETAKPIEETKTNEFRGRCAKDYEKIYNTLLNNYDKINTLLQTNDFNMIQKLFANVGITLTKTNNVIYINSYTYNRIYQACYTEKTGKIYNILVKLEQIMNKLPANISPYIHKDSISKEELDKQFEAINKSIETDQDKMERLFKEASKLDDDKINTVLKQAYKTENLQTIFDKHPVLNDIINNNRYENVYKIPLLNAINLIDNSEAKNNLINKLIDKLKNLPNTQTIINELTNNISLPSNLISTLTNGYDTNIETVFRNYHILEEIFKENIYNISFESSLFNAIKNIKPAFKNQLIKLLIDKLKDINSINKDSKANNTIKKLSDPDSLSAYLNTPRSQSRDRNKSPKRPSSSNSKSPSRTKGGNNNSADTISKVLIKFKRKDKVSKRSSKKNSKKNSKKSSKKNK
jgi:hypothetical protein